MAFIHVTICLNKSDIALGTLDIVLNKSDVALGTLNINLSKSDIALGTLNINLTKSDIALGILEILLTKEDIALGTLNITLSKEDISTAAMQAVLETINVFDYNTLNVTGRILANGDTIVDSKLCWSTSPNVTLETSSNVSAGGAQGPISISPTLSSNTTYYFKLWVKNSNNDIVYSNELTGTTRAAANGNAHYIALTSTSAVGYWGGNYRTNTKLCIDITLQKVGGNFNVLPIIGEIGVYYKQGSYGLPYEGGSKITTSYINAASAGGVLIQDLTPNTMYIVCMYAIVDSVTIYGNVLALQTLS